MIVQYSLLLLLLNPIITVFASDLQGMFYVIFCFERKIIPYFPYLRNFSRVFFKIIFSLTLLKFRY